MPRAGPEANPRRQLSAIGCFAALNLEDMLALLTSPVPFYRNFLLILDLAGFCQFGLPKTHRKFILIGGIFPRLCPRGNRSLPVLGDLISVIFVWY